MLTHAACHTPLSFQLGVSYSHWFWSIVYPCMPDKSGDETKSLYCSKSVQHPNGFLHLQYEVGNQQWICLAGTLSPWYDVYPQWQQSPKFDNGHSNACSWPIHVRIGPKKQNCSLAGQAATGPTYSTIQNMSRMKCCITAAIWHTHILQLSPISCQELGEKFQVTKVF